MKFKKPIIESYSSSEIECIVMSRACTTAGPFICKCYTVCQNYMPTYTSGRC